MVIKNKVIAGAILVLFVGLAGYGVYKNKADQGESIKVGFIGFPTGPLSALGEIQLNAAKMAVEDINEKGGIDGKKMELVIEDYGFDTKRAIPAYEALKAKGIRFFDVEGGPAGAILPALIRKDGNLAMNAVLVLPSYTDNNPLTCRISLRGQHYAPAIAQYILENNKRPRIAFLISNNDYGVQVRDAVADIIKENGGSVVIEESFEQSAVDFKAQIMKLKANEQNIDALVVINAGNTAQVMFNQLKTLGFSKQIVGDNWTAANPSIKEKSSVEGVAYADYPWTADADGSDSAEVAEFKKDFFEKYGQQPSPIAVNTYDAIHILAKGLSEASEQTPDAVAAYLTKNLGVYNGIGGKIEFNDDCEAQRSVVMRIVQNGKMTELSATKK